MTDNRTTHDDNQLKQAHVEELLAALLPFMQNNLNP